MYKFEKYPFKRFWVEAAIQAAGALGSAVTSGVSQGSANKKTREFNKEEAEKQRAWTEEMYHDANAWNYEMWQKEMEYNSPEAQVQRLRDAGLNPMYYGLDGNSSNSFAEAAQPLGYERAKADDQPNPVAVGLSSGMDAAMKTAQISSIELDNELKKKEIGWYDKEHQQDYDFKTASIDEVRSRITEIQSRVDNNQMDYLLKAKDLDKKDAEIAVEWAKFVSVGLDNELKQQINPLMVRAQELENQLSEVHNQYEAERIVAELAEVRAHTAALYAQAALDGAKKEGVQLDNKIKEAEVKFAPSNARNRANLLKWTADEQRYKSSVLKNTWKGKVSIDNYYAEHYEEAFRNSWSKSGVEFGYSQAMAQGIGSAALLGMLLAF